MREPSQPDHEQQGNEIETGYFDPKSFLIGLVIPFVFVIGGVAVLSHSRFLVLGFPVVYFWLFLWFLLTPLCLATSWHFFDRRHYENEEDTSREAENPGG